MSGPVSIIDAVTAPGPLAFSDMRFGPSEYMRNAIALMLRTISVTSSCTPVIDENSCRTLLIWIDVTAAPCSDDRRTRRNALPSVRPNPRSSGSATMVASREASMPGSICSLFGLINACQFLFIARDDLICVVPPFVAAWAGRMTSGHR